MNYTHKKLAGSQFVIIFYCIYNQMICNQPYVDNTNTFSYSLVTIDNTKFTKVYWLTVNKVCSVVIVRL